VAHHGSRRTIADVRVEDEAGSLVARAHGSFTPNRAYDPARFH
jgi:acyl-coenzyme A thioesterase PaaI-like protein